MPQSLAGQMPSPDPSIWIQSHGAMAQALATFQKTRPVAASADIDHVITAIAPAFDLGFAYSFKPLSGSELQVTVHHSGGWDSSAVFDGSTGDAGRVLAGLMGIRIASQAAPAQEQPSAELDALIEQADQQAAAIADQPEPDAEPVNLMGEGSPDHELLPEQLAPLSASDKDTCVATLRAMSADARKRFTVAFRDHFNVPRESKTLTPHITQQVHLEFIQNFINELELSGVAA